MDHYMYHVASFLCMDHHNHHVTPLIFMHTNIGVRVSGRAIRNDERNRVSQVNEGSGINEGVLHVSKY